MIRRNLQSPQYGKAVSGTTFVVNQYGGRKYSGAYFAHLGDKLSVLKKRACIFPKPLTSIKDKKLEIDIYFFYKRDRSAVSRSMKIRWMNCKRM